MLYLLRSALESTRQFMRSNLAQKRGISCPIDLRGLRTSKYIHLHCRQLRGRRTFSATAQAGSGTNSLDKSSGLVSERVELITLDSFVEKNGVDSISMLKIDTEGFDLAVLQGARQFLTDGRIELIQFEYNWRWLLNKASLLNVFKLAKDMPYLLGKLTGRSIEFYDAWHFELDRYFENNYVLVRHGSSIEELGNTVRFDNRNCPQSVRN